MAKVYLGDSVYVEFDGYMLTLTTENGYGPSNTIHLEPAVYRALEEYVKMLTDEAEAQDGPSGSATAKITSAEVEYFLYLRAGADDDRGGRR